MTIRTMRRNVAAGIAASLVALGGVTLGAAVPVSVPSAAFATDGNTGASEVDVNAATDTASCAVESSAVSWGLKTSFRNYISGSIANGEWLTENGASYETPAFRWSEGSGELANDLSSGSVAFTGDVFFSGHDGLLRLNVSNPEIVFTGNGSAQLVLDIGSDDTGEAEIVQERVVAAKVNLAGYTVGDGQEFSVIDAPVHLTADGAEALNGAFGDYVSGEEMDPLTLTANVPGCSLSNDAAPGETEDAEGEDDASTSATDAPEAEPINAPAEVPWVPIIVGGVALLVVLVTAGMLIAGRKKGPGADAGV